MYFFKTIVIALFTLFLFSACSDDKPRYILDENPSGLAIKYLEITPSDVTVPLGTSGTLVAIAHYEDASNEDVSARVQWNSSDEKIVTVFSGGEIPGAAKAVGLGKAMITAKYSGVISNTANITVGDVTLDSIQLTPLQSSVAKGVAVAYSAVALYSDGSHSDVTSLASFSSSDISVATIETAGVDAGIATTVGVGVTTISASFDGKTSNSAELNVSSASADRLEITPPDVQVPKGTTGAYSATLYYADGTHVDVTRQATWVSKDTSVVRIENGTSAAGFAEAVAVGETKVQAKFEALFSNEASVVVSDALLEHINVIPAIKTTAQGSKVQYIAIGLYSDGRHVNLTNQATWDSSNTTVATISALGLADTLSVGSTVITASFESKTSNNADLNVTAATVTSLQITPAHADVPQGTTGQYRATAYYSDMSSADVTAQATWNSTQNSVVNIITSGMDAGSASALSVGESNITAIFESTTSNIATVSVSDAVLQSIEISPMRSSVAKGINVQYQAMGIYSDSSSVDISNEVNWRSSALDVAIMSSTGLAYTVAKGSTKITAVLGSISSANADLNVSNASITSLAITPADTTVPKGTTGAYTAIATYTDTSTLDVTNQATWISENPTIVNIGTNTGAAQALLEGNTTIAANFDGANSNTATIEVTNTTLQTIEVTPTTTSVAQGIEVSYRAIGVYLDGNRVDITNQASWSSSDTNIATISSDGVAQTLSKGTATISAFFSGVTSNNATLEVTDKIIESIYITPADITVPKGTTGNYTAIAIYSDTTESDITTQATWISDNPSAVEIDINSGFGEALEVGQSRVTASLSGTTSNISNVTVVQASLVGLQLDPVVKTVPNGIEVEYRVIASYSDTHTSDVTEFCEFNSSNTGVASFEEGSWIAQTHAVGSSTITASYNGALSNEATLHVTDKTTLRVEVEPAVVSVPAGTTGSLVATAYFSDNTHLDVSAQALWSSADETVLKVGNDGFVTTLAVGDTAVTALYDNQSGEANVSVTNTVLDYIELTPFDETIPNGYTQQYSLTAVYLDKTTRDVTDLATYSSSDESVATIGGSGGASGKAVTHSEGSTDITANFGGKTSNVSILTVTAATVTSVQIEPGNVSMPAGTTGKYTAIAYFSDSTSQDVTSQAFWNSSDINVTVIQTGGSNAGYAQALSVGDANITAQYAQVNSNTAYVAVTAATLDRVELTPIESFLPNGLTLQYTALGIYSDNTKVDLTSFAEFNSSNPSVASFSNAGLITAHSENSITATASYDGVRSNTVNLTITSPVALSVVVSPVNKTYPIGIKGNFTAMAYLSDGNNSDVTTESIWNSSSPSVISIVTSGANAGEAQSLAAGESMITAEYQGISSNSAHITVSDVTLDSIVVRPAKKIILVDTTLEYSATGIFSDNTSQDLSEYVTWTSDDTSKVTISSTGVATGINSGTANIKAEYNAKVSNDATLIVVPFTIDSIVITPANLVEPAGISWQLIATANLSNGTTKDVTDQVTWSSSDTDVVWVNNRVFAGLAYLQIAGTSTISAQLGSVVGTEDIEVVDITLESIIVDPPLTSVVEGSTVQYTATGVYNNGDHTDISNDVLWTSSDVSVATIDTSGLAQTIISSEASIKTTQISASLDGISKSVPLNVSTATVDFIEITPSSLDEPAGTSGQLSAIAHFNNGTTQDITKTATWVSTNLTVASVGNGEIEGGLTNLLSKGTCNITASFESLTASIDVTVTDAVLVAIILSPLEANSIVTLETKYSAIGVYSDDFQTPINGDVAWRSSNPSVATIQSDGVATATSAGETDIVATSINSPLINSATKLYVSNPTVDHIEVNPKLGNLSVAEHLDLHAIAITQSTAPFDITNDVIWLSSNEDVLSVDTGGAAIGVSPGLVTVEAHLNYLGDNFSDSAVILVNNGTLSSIVVSTNTPEIEIGGTSQFIATGLYDSNVSQEITEDAVWISSDPLIATVSNVEGSKGLVSGVSAGSADITATHDNITDTHPINVLDASLVSLAITPVDASIANGLAQQYRAIGTFSDDSSHDITNEVQWSSSVTSVAQIDTLGLATSIGAGTTTISAKINTIEDSTDLTVTSSTNITFNIAPLDTSIALGTTQQFTATLTVDGNANDVTNLTVWDSVTQSVATISNVVDVDIGLATSVGAGLTNISASYHHLDNGITYTASTTLSVADLTDKPTSVRIEPGTPSMVDNEALQLHLIGVWEISGGTPYEQDLTLEPQTTWSSSDKKVATVDNSGETKGLAHGLKEGTSTINGQFRGVEADETLTVTP